MSKDKIRIYELARELGMTNKELISLLHDLGTEVTSHVCAVEKETAQAVRELVGSKTKGPAAEPAKAEKPEKKPPQAPTPAPAAEDRAPATRQVTAPTVPKPAAKHEVKIPASRPAVVSPAKPMAKQAAPVKAVSREMIPPSPRVTVKKDIATSAIREAPAKVPVIVPPKAPPREVARPEAPARPEAKEIKRVELIAPITVGALARKLSIGVNDTIKILMKHGLMLTINQTLDLERAKLVGKALGIEIVAKTPPAEAVVPKKIEEDKGKLVPRPPVVTVLGHVDHGKTSLLDAIRQTNVTAEEAGGITQKIGAYVVERGPRKIVFLDTPGHEAFTAMRARGAKVTDIAVLVVAADDGVMPQTIEAINHARAAKVPILVAINKIDKPQANPERVKQQLADLDLLPEDWGGDTICIPCSARDKTGLDELMEMLLLLADMQGLKANPDRRAAGTIIEAKLDKGLGPVATVLAQNGTLWIGDAVVAGNTWGKIRTMINDKGERVRKAPPSTPVEIIGLSGVPQAGDILQVIDDERVARQIAESRAKRTREEKIRSVQRVTFDDLVRQMQEGETKDLNVIVKADGQGSVEALRHALTRLSTREVKINVIHGGVGTITESDILLASASKAIVIGFNVRPDPNIKKLAESENVDIRLYRVIYNVIDEMKAAMAGMLEPEFEEILVGRAEIRQIFKISKVGIIAGCYITEGKISRNASVRLVRDGVVIYEGKVESLKRFKEDVSEVEKGFECGIGVDKFSGMQPGDIIEAYQMQEKKTKEMGI